MKKCPPGVICVENVTLFLLFIILLVLIFFIYMNTNKNKIVNDTDHITIKNQRDNSSGLFGYNYNWLPSWPYNNLPSDPLLNPYAPPLRDERYFIPELSYIQRAIPINISTNIGAVDTTYRQLGILTPLNSTNQSNDSSYSKILP